MNSHSLYALYLAFMILLLGKSQVYNLLAPWYEVLQAKNVVQAKRPLTKKARPLVSVVIAAWNEEIGLETTIKAILANSYRPLEVIIINDGSTDRTDELARAFMERYEQEMVDSPRRAVIRYQYQKNAGKSSALNLGIQLANGELIVTVDADSLPFENTIEQFVVAFVADPEIMAVAGHVIVGNTETVLGSMQFLEYITGYFSKAGETLFFRSIVTLPGPASAFRSEVFKTVGGFRSNMLTEDMELTLRLHKAGMPITYAEHARVYTEAPNTIQGLIKQRTRWRRGHLEAYWMHRNLFFSNAAKKDFFFFCLVMPLNVMELIMTIPSVPLVLFLLIVTIFTGNTTLIATSIIYNALWFSFLLLRDKHYHQWRFLSLIPVAFFGTFALWLIDTYALVMALRAIINKQAPNWQKLQRTGVID
jgi:poly-beta-1,6-N-acetyl-D-glucosamine synthase